MKTNKTLLSLAVAGGLLAVSTTSNAAGFQLAEYSATGLGRAYAGEAAMADNASAQWRNPAMLTYLEGTQFSLGAIYVDPNIDAKGSVFDKKTGLTHDASAKDYADSAVIPNIYVSHQINEKLFSGLALSSNYGMKTDLGSDFSASHYGNQAEVKTMEANVNLGYKINPTLSVGGGIRYIMAEGHFGAAGPTHSVVPGVANNQLKYMEGDTTDWGWQVGTAWQINQDHRIGFTYKSEVNLKLKGTAEGIGFGLAPGAKTSGTLPLTLPATAELASFHQLTEKFALHASLNWTDWSSFEKLEATLNGLPSNPYNVKDENWEDNYRFALGASYQLDTKWLIRTGIAYDTSAVSDKNRSATIPETDRTWLSVGTGYQWSEQLSFDAGFTYILTKDASIDEPRGASDMTANAVGGTFVGETSGNIVLFGVQANYHF